MARPFCLDPVIREVDGDTSASRRSTRLIIIDPATRRAAPKKRLFHEAKYFLVTNNGDGAGGVECALPGIQIRDFNSDLTATIKISYQASCDPGNEEKVAEALFDGPHPGAVLNEKIRKYLMDYIEHRPAEFIYSYFERREALQAFISSRVRQEVGLNLQARLALEGEESLRTIPVGPLSLTVRFKDYVEDQTLSVRGELQVDEPCKIRALLYRSGFSRLEDVFKREICNYFARNLSLQRFSTDLHGGVREQLTAHLNEALSFAGRRIGFISFEGTTISNGALPFFEVQHDVKCTIQQHPTQVVIKNTVQMILQDLARFRAIASQDLGEWIRKTLDRVVHELLFDARYIDLLLHFQPLGERIKRRLSAEAESIGYTIKHLVTVPDLEPLTWLKPFPIVVEDSFQTQSSGVKVSLRIVVMARIEDLRDVKQYLNPGQDIPGLMKDGILRTVRHFLYTVDPERFYMRFSFTPNGAERAVSDELIDLAKTLLERDYRAQVLEVTPTVLDTDYIKHLMELQKEIGHFQIIVSPVGLKDSETFVYTGTFRVEAVDSNGWDKFRLLNSSIAGIQAHVEEYVRPKLETLSSEVLAYRTFQELNALERAIEELARKSVIEEFGLVIRIASTRRKQTDIEQLVKLGELHRITAGLEVQQHQVDMEALREKNRNTSTTEAIGELQAGLLRSALTDGDEEEVARLEKQISKLRKSLPRGEVATRNELEQLYGGNRKGPATCLEDFRVPKALPGEQAPPSTEQDGEP